MDAVLCVIRFIQAMGYQAFREVPDAEPSEYCTVTLDGGGMLTERISTPMLTIICHAQDMKRARVIAFDLAANIQQSMTADVREVFQADVNSVYPDPDLDTGAPAYSITLALTITD